MLVNHKIILKWGEMALMIFTEDALDIKFACGTAIAARLLPWNS